ncbi:hypothetical protein [Parasitella parasitica]|uniref:Uncharacterized protein n=1 Tax=Parasitella parasitica TaxID=35722 RepID=A0A0B7MXQ3_9FUNG|nr:hypothetical protein [Parasitella parasitica]
MESKRQRRYTIARPESALALLTTENDDMLPEDDQQFDRIADILSNLIQEANQAVSIPMVRKLSNTAHNPTINKKKSAKRHPPSRRPSTNISIPFLSSPTLPTSTCMITRKPYVTQQKINTTATTTAAAAPILLESFKRLDSSMAIIDSLSRDLIMPTSTIYSTAKTTATIVSTAAGQQEKKRSLTFDSRLSALILIPLFHVPHVLISMVFDTMSNYDTLVPVSSLAAENSNSFSGMLIWAFIFAVTNVIMIENAIPASAAPPPAQTASKTIPGAFIHGKRKRRSSSKGKRSFNLHQNTRMMHAFCPLPTHDRLFPDARFASVATTTATTCAPVAAVRARRNSF